MDEKIDVELWEIPYQHVGLGAVEVEIAFEVMPQLVYDFVTYYRAEIAENGESVVVIVQRVNETLD
jgi:xylose isomerase